MQHSIQFFARKLGERPILVLFSLLLLNVWVCIRLIQFILVADGGDVFLQINQIMEAWLMVIFIVTVSVVLIWRLTIADKILRHSVLDKYRLAKELIDSDAQKNIRQLADRLRGNPNLFRKLLRLVTLVPEAFVTLTLSFALANIVLYIVAYFKFHDFVYCNCPWAVAAFICVHLVYNDIWVIESLKKTIGSIPIMEFADLLKLVEKFMKQLTERERIVLGMHYIEDLTNGDMAKKLNIEEVTVRTHINNINRKWDPFKDEIRVNVTIKELLVLFFRLRKLNLI